jgi:8-oxo-dGTP pyrophosphatase MutT (NUDIX family)
MMWNVRGLFVAPNGACTTVATSSSLSSRYGGAFFRRVRSSSESTKLAACTASPPPPHDLRLAMAHLSHLSPVQLSAVEVRSAATVICARQRRRVGGTTPQPASGPFLLRKRDFVGDDDHAFLDVDDFFGHHDEVSFECGWEVLLGQSEVVNFMKPRAAGGAPVPMRYGGEWKLAGGHIDDGESPHEAAVRVRAWLATP